MEIIIENDLKALIDSCEYVVDQKMLDYFDSKWNDGNCGYTSRLNVECECLEYAMLASGHTVLDMPLRGERYVWRNDGIFHNLKVDFKEWAMTTPNISFNLNKLNESTTLGCLTHLVIWSRNIRGPLKLGDRLKFKCHSIVDMKTVNTKAINRGNYHLLKV